MESQVFDIVKMEKEKAVARFNQFRRVAKLRQVLEVFLVLGLVSWSSARVPAAAKAAARLLVEVSNYLFNHHVVFVIGNAIIVLLLVLCRKNNDGGGVSFSGDAGVDFYDDYVKHSEAVRSEPEPTPLDLPAEVYDDRSPNLGCDAAHRSPYTSSAAIDDDVAKECDDVAAAIDKAARQIRRFQRTQSEKLKRDIAARPKAELRRSETQGRRETAVSGDGFVAGDMERLSSEEFRRTVDEFIDRHWIRKETKRDDRLLEMVY